MKRLLSIALLTPLGCGSLSAMFGSSDEVWRRDIGGPADRVVVDDYVVRVDRSSGTTGFFDLQDGLPLIEHGPIDSSFTIPSRRAIAASAAQRGSRLVGVPSGQNPAWLVDRSGHFIAGAADVHKVVLLEGPAPDEPDKAIRGRVTAYRRVDGERLWELPILSFDVVDEVTAGAVHLSDESVFVAFSDLLLRLDPEVGSLFWRHPLPRMPEALQTGVRFIHADGLTFVTEGEKLALINPRGVAWEMSLRPGSKVEHISRSSSGALVISRGDDAASVARISEADGALIWMAIRGDARPQVPGVARIGGRGFLVASQKLLMADMESGKVETLKTFDEGQFDRLMPVEESFALVGAHHIELYDQTGALVWQSEAAKADGRYRPREDSPFVLNVDHSRAAAEVVDLLAREVIELDLPRAPDGCATDAAIDRRGRYLVSFPIGTCSDQGMLAALRVR